MEEKEIVKKEPGESSEEQDDSKTSREEQNQNDNSGTENEEQNQGTDTSAGQLSSGKNIRRPVMPTMKVKMKTIPSTRKMTAMPTAVRMTGKAQQERTMPTHRNSRIIKMIRIMPTHKIC